MRKQILGLLALAMLTAPAVANANAADCGATDVPLLISADVTVNTTWSGTVVLTQPIFVKNGATLTILAGTIVRGQPRTAAVTQGSTVGTPGALIVTSNGRLVADGSATNSIIMTTAVVDNNNDGVGDDDDANGFKDAWVAGDTFLDDECGTRPLSPLAADGTSNTNLWGGLVINGNAPVNTLNGTFQVEGLTVPGFPVADVLCGGDEPHDNSGSLTYVSVRHAGDEIGLSNELNGITLCGVGDGTKLSYAEVYVNFDDGIEWFGGTVNGDHLVISFVGDDSYDVDLGYTGVNQFLFDMHTFFDLDNGTTYGSVSGDKLGEWDGDNFDEGLGNVCVRADGSQCPHPGFDFWNMTGIGTLQPANAAWFDPASANRGVQFRHCAAGRLYNSVIVNTGTAKGLDIDPLMPSGTSCGAGFGSHDVAAHTTQGLITMSCTTMQDVPALGATETTASTNGNTLSLLLGAGASSANSINPPTSGLSGAFSLVNENTTFDVSGVLGKLDPSLKATKIDPRLVTGGLGRPNAGCPAPPMPLDSAAVYRGAFAIGAPELWTKGWTAMNQGGLLAD